MAQCERALQTGRDLVEWQSRMPGWVSSQFSIYLHEDIKSKVGRRCQVPVHCAIYGKTSCICTQLKSSYTLCQVVILLLPHTQQPVIQIKLNAYRKISVSFLLVIEN